MLSTAIETFMEADRAYFTPSPAHGAESRGEGPSEFGFLQSCE